MDQLKVYRDAVAWARRAVAGVRADQWDQMSNCDPWTVRDLVNHMVSGNWWVPELVGGKTIDEVGDRLDGDQLGDDPLAAYDASAAAAYAAFSAPGGMDAACAVSYGPIPGSVYCAHRFMDALIHGWDIAHSTGQDDHLDPTLVAALRAQIEPEREMLAASGAFGDGVSVPPAADPETELLAWLGRAR